MLFREIPSIFRIILLGLLALWAIFLFVGFLPGSKESRKARHTPRWWRLGSSAVLVVAAWIWAWTAHGVAFSNYFLFIAAGMSLGFVGDLLMAGVFRWQKYVLGGMLAFGLGHIAYIRGFVLVGQKLQIAFDSTLYVVWSIWLVVGLLGWYLAVARKQERALLHWAALPYSLLLATTAAFATLLALHTTYFLPLMLGGALFLLSDLILAIKLFRHFRFPIIDDFVWLCYGPAQMLIVYSAAGALHLALEV